MLPRARKPRLESQSILGPSHCHGSGCWRQGGIATGQRLSCPTLLLVGSEDPIVPASVMHEVSALVSESEVVVIEQAGHSAYFEKPSEFNRHVLDFIDRRITHAGVLQ